jgi:hypothetical protein
MILAFTLTALLLISTAWLVGQYRARAFSGAPPREADAAAPERDDGTGSLKAA